MDVFFILAASLPWVVWWAYCRGKTEGLREAKRRVDVGLKSVGLVTGILDEYKR